VLTWIGRPLSSGCLLYDGYVATASVVSDELSRHMHMTFALAWFMVGGNLLWRVRRLIAKEWERQREDESQAPWTGFWGRIGE